MNDPKLTQPDPAPSTDSMLDRALILHDRGEIENAEVLFKTILSREPRHFAALHQLGVIQSQRNGHEDAVRFFERALESNPRSAMARLNLGIAFWNLGRFAEAEAQLRNALLANPRNAETHLNLGICLRSLARPTEALASFDAALLIQPDNVKATLNRGSVLHSLQQPEAALADYDRALSFRPLDVDVWTGRSAVLQALHRPEEALESCDRALSLHADHPDALMNRGTALLDLDRPAEALASLERSLLLKPDQADAHMNRGNALVKLRRLNEALTAFERSLSLQPNHLETLMNRGLTLHLLGRHAEAIADFDRVLAQEPRQPAAHSAKIFILDYLPDLTFEKHQEERHRYYLANAREIACDPGAFPNDRNPDRPLVLGYVSSDFKRHSAAAAFGPVLKHHSKGDFRVICYSEVLVEDELTRQLQGYVHDWVRTSGLTDDAMAARIRQDGVDILIDLSGHSYRNRLLVFARKPAPIQVTAWGHSGGTGLPMIDYHFTDPTHVPASARPLFAESCWDLPCCITYEPPTFAPPVAELPAGRAGYVTFGSLNRFSKITPALIDLWAAILGSVPGSRLLLKDGGFDDPQTQREVRAKFSRHGVAGERIEMRGFTTHLDHLATYGEVDVVLDTFPQNGGISTWESLWMGAPVQAMLGNHPSSRVSAAILGALDLQDWVSHDEAGYLSSAIERAQDLGSLARFRESIRARIAASRAGNPRRYTLEVEAAYRAMWRNWLSH